MRYLSGLESILCYDDGIDVAELTRHPERLEEDVSLVRATGLDWFRYPWRWHEIERQPGRYDWSSTDLAMQALRARGIAPVVDPCHHISIPAFLKGGFADPSFVDRYVDFVAAGAERYDWVTQYTLFNEPYPTTLFCGKTGFWFPYRTSDRDFVAMALNAATAICRLSALLSQRPGFQSVHFETCEHHQGLDEDGRAWARRENSMRFLVTDLILGRVNQDHPLYSWLVDNGLTGDRMRWFWREPAQIDILGLNYYAHSEMQWRRGASGMESTRPSASPRGFRAVARDYVERYGRRVMLGETNIRGTPYERITWLKYTLQECEALCVDPGTACAGYCWFPLWDSCAWARDLCRTAKTEPDPVGIYLLEPRTMRRLPSALSDCFRRLVKGEWTSRDIPAYRPTREMQSVLRGYEPFFAGWRWSDPPTEALAA